MRPASLLCSPSWPAARAPCCSRRWRTWGSRRPGPLGERPVTLRVPTRMKLNSMVSIPGRLFRCHRPTPHSVRMTSAELVGSRPPRRAHARLILALDGTAATSADLVRALRDAVRHEGTVLACAVVDPRADDAERELVRARLEEQVGRAVEETGLHGRTETALLEPALFEALCATARGGTLVVVQENHRTVLRSAPVRVPGRPLVRPA